MIELNVTYLQIDLSVDWDQYARCNVHCSSLELTIQKQPIQSMYYYIIDVITQTLIVLDHAHVGWFKWFWVSIT